MILNINDDEFLENPDADQVAAAVESLTFDQFAILVRGDQEYIQTYHNDDGTFQLEYREGSADEHYAVVDEAISLAHDVASAFVSYLQGMMDWKANWSWGKVEFDDDFEGDLTSENAYLINGQEFERVTVGDEREEAVSEDGRCTCCNARTGEYHYSECENEECPCCHGRLLLCDCE